MAMSLRLSTYSLNCAGIDAQEIPQGQTLKLPINASFKDVERLYLKELLRASILSEAITISGLSRTTLWRRLRILDIES